VEVDRSTQILILLFPVALAVCAYLLAWRVRRRSIQRLALLIVACLCAFFGWIGIFGYAIPGLEDFRGLPNKLVPIATAIFWNVVVWSICIGAWVIAVRCVCFAFRKKPGVTTS